MKICKAKLPYNLLVATREIETGDKLTSDCYGRNGQKVASEGDEVDEKIKNRMQNMDVRKAWLERSIPEWMPLAEAQYRNYDIEESFDVSPLHFQILTNLQGTFSTDGLQQLINRIKESSTDTKDLIHDEIISLSEQVNKTSNREDKIHEQIEKIENDQLRERYYNLLASASPQAADPSDIEEEGASIGRKIQGFLEDLNELKTSISNLILDMDVKKLTNLFNLGEIQDYESIPDFADAFVLFERFYSLPGMDEDPVVEKLFEQSQKLLKSMFYFREVDEDLLESIDNILWENFSHNFNHWFITLPLPDALDSYLLTHSVNTAIMVSQLYKTVGKEPQADTKELTLACLVKDFGMVLVPQSYHLHDQELTQEQREKLKIHPMTSKEFLEDIISSYHKASQLIEKHHEKLNGEGYPMSARQLNDDQKLLNVCDTFDAMTSPRTWRPPIPPSQAIKFLRHDAGDSLDAYWVRVLIRAIGVFPVGSIVKISGEEPAIVLNSNPHDPLHPQLVTVRSLMNDGVEAEIINTESDNVKIQEGGSFRKAPPRIRELLSDHRQIFSRLNKSA